MVLDRILDNNNVIKIPSKITNSTAKEERTEEAKPVKKLPIKMLAIVIRIGKRPLQGTNELVKMAMRRSRGESMILQPTIPCCITTKSHAHGSDKMVVFESVDKCGILSFVNVKFGVYFRV